MTLEPTEQRKIDGFHFRRRVKALGITLAEFALECGKSRGTISNVVTGKHCAREIPLWARAKLEWLEESKKKSK